MMFLWNPFISPTTVGFSFFWTVTFFRCLLFVMHMAAVGQGNVEKHEKNEIIQKLKKSQRVQCTRKHLKVLPGSCN